MAARFVSIWFPYLATDWFSLRQPQLRNVPFVLRAPSHGRMIITAANAGAVSAGITTGMAVADARALVPALEVMDDQPDLAGRLLKKLALWCIRFTPVAAVDLPDGILLDASGCTHLWGGDAFYIADIEKKLGSRGYTVRVAIADTPGVARAVARFGSEPLIVPAGNCLSALLPLPPEALRLEEETIERLRKLGLQTISQFIFLPRSSLRRRFGMQILNCIDMALGKEKEHVNPVQPIEPYQERLPCMEPIFTATGIDIALKQLLESLCSRLVQEQKGLRKAIFHCYRIDGEIQTLEIGTGAPSYHVDHLSRLFEIKLQMLDPGPGIELFVLEAPLVEDHPSKQERIWQSSGGLENTELAELIDRLSCKTGKEAIRYLPQERYWPERSVRRASSLFEKPPTAWPAGRLRPLLLLKNPERIDVTAPIPDYPPMLFRHKGIVHKVARADGPERIEQEWWIRHGQHRDYYRVEDEAGKRYWLFRLGHYHEGYQWFLHGYFP